MLGKLLALIDTGEFEDLGWVRLLAARWNADDLELRFRVNPGKGRAQIWLLRCSGVLEHHLVDADGGGLNHWEEDHPAIAQYTSARERLFIRKASRDPDRSVGALWHAHRLATDDWVPFERYLNAEVPLRDLLSGPSGGFLAEAPDFLVDRYLPILQAEGCEPYTLTLESSSPIERAELLHFGASYVIARSVRARRAAA